MTMKFCTGCQKDRPVDGGQYKKTKIVRWMCKECLSKHVQGRLSTKEKQGDSTQYRNDR